jgi:hypothetical protein
MSDMNDPKSGALEPIRTEALDTVRPPAQQLRWNARATHRAMQGWQRVQSQADWERINEESGEQYESGAFLLERLGADRFLDPRLMATILALRQRLIAESGITTAAETMLVDQAVLSYYHTLRVQGWIGDLAVRIEHEFFGDDAFTEMARKGHRRADRFAVEDRVRQLSEQLMPLSDRANRMMIRNLKAIKELRQGQVPAIAKDLDAHELHRGGHDQRPWLGPTPSTCRPARCFWRAATRSRDRAPPRAPAAATPRK